MPTFNGYDNSCLSQALQYITNLVTHGKVFRIVDLSGITKSQRGYLHLCCGIAAKELGVTTAYVKQEYYKKICNFDVFAQTVHDPVTGEWEVTYKSSEDLPKEEISATIERFRNWLLTCDKLPHPIYTPAPDDRQAINRAFVEVDNYNKKFGYAR